MKRTILCVAVLAACQTGEIETVETSEQAVFNCSDPAQRLTCAPPGDSSKRFVCHATNSSTNPYVKISVPVNSSSHTPGVAHGSGHADQTPGASANDVGGAVGLDCDCSPRACNDVCSGAEDGIACDDGNACTADSACSNGTCLAGAPSCSAGGAVDACTTQTGACDAATGECLTETRDCDDGDPTTDDSCSPTGGCVNTPRPSQSTFSWEVSTDNGVTWFPVTLPNTNFGCTFCSRMYRTFFTGVPTAVSFRFGSDNEARMLVNGAIVFDDYYVNGVDWCTANTCCSQCCDTVFNCTNIVDNQSPFSLGDLSQFGLGVNEIRWQVNQQTGGSGFHTAMEITY